MRILGINGGNGVLVHTMKKDLVANYEPRSVFKSRDNKQWEINFSGIPLFNGTLDFYDHFDKGLIKSIDSIVSAPDCGHSSQLAYSRAKKLSNPEENLSFRLFTDSIKCIRPRVFMMENLAKSLELVTKDDWSLNFPDYEFIFHCESVSKWGNSQINRKRLILIGLNKERLGDALDKSRDYFSHIYRVNDLKTSGELIEGCEDYSGHYREKIDEEITLYAGYKNTLRNIRNFWLNNPNLKRYPVTNRNFQNAPGVYRNLKNDYPATARKANRQFNHRGLQMTPRELARIQGVPDNFEIYFDEKNINYWINKGRTTVTKTPPYQIGQWFYNQLIKSEKLWKS